MKYWIHILALGIFYHSFGKVVPALPLKGDAYKSTVYTTRVSAGSGFRSSGTYQHTKSQFAHDGNTSQVPYWSDDHFTQFSSNQLVEVEVSKIGSNVTNYEFRPATNVTAIQIQNGKLFFKILPDKYVTLIMNGDQKKPLHIFSDPLETKIPDKTCPNVFIVKDGATSVSNPLKLSDVGNATTLYFEPGGIHYIGIGFKITDDNSGARINSNRLKEIYIPSGALVVGSIRANKINDMKIHGRGILCGQHAYPYQSSGDYLNRIYNSAISMADYGGTVSRNQTIEGIISLWPLKYHFLTSSGSTVQYVKCFSFHETTDGIGTGKNSVVRNSFFKVNDDVVKLYADNIYCENLYVWHQTNGAVFQFGWNESQGQACVVNNTILLNDDSYFSKGTGWWSNHAIINWMGTNKSNALHKNHIIDGINTSGMPLIPVWKLVAINLDCSEGCGNSAGGIMENLFLKNIQIGAQKTTSYAGVNKSISSVSIKQCQVKSSGSDLIIAKRQSNGGIVTVNVENSQCGNPGTSAGFSAWVGGTGGGCPLADPNPNTLPQVAITQPTSGGIFISPASISLNADAWDSDGTIEKVEFYNGATLIGTDAAAPYSVNWTNVLAGKYSLTAKATDSDGGISLSSMVSLTVENPNVPPQISLTSPIANTSYTAPANVVVSASAFDTDGSISEVKFFSGTTLLARVTTAPYSFTWQNVAKGSYSIKGIALDNKGDSTYSASVVILVDNPISDISDLRATSNSCHEVLLQWSDVGSETGYRVRRKKITDAIYTILGDLPANTTMYIDPLAVSGQPYLYMIRPLQNGVPVKISNTATITLPSCSLLTRVANEVQDDFSIEPSPFESEFTVHLTYESDDATAQLFDARGKQLENIQVEKISATDFQVYTHGLASGWYFLKINTQDGPRLMKVLKQ